MKNLKKLRERDGYSQIEMAKILKVSQSTYSQYENGNSQPTIETMIKMANLFEIPMDMLLGRKWEYIDIKEETEECPSRGT